MMMILNVLAFVVPMKVKNVNILMCCEQPAWNSLETLASAATQHDTEKK